MCGRLPRLCLEAGGWLVLMEWRVCMYCKWRECGGVNEMAMKPFQASSRTRANSGFAPAGANPAGSKSCTPTFAFVLHSTFVAFLSLL